jgi:hypothetical protein
LIGGNGDSANGGISGLLGLQLLEQVQKKNLETVPATEEKAINHFNISVRIRIKKTQHHIYSVQKIFLFTLKTFNHSIYLLPDFAAKEESSRF